MLCSSVTPVLSAQGRSFMTVGVWLGFASDSPHVSRTLYIRIVHYQEDRKKRGVRQYRWPIETGGSRKTVAEIVASIVSPSCGVSRCSCLVYALSALRLAKGERSRGRGPEAAPLLGTGCQYGGDRRCAGDAHDQQQLSGLVHSELQRGLPRRAGIGPCGRILGENLVVSELTDAHD